MPVAITLSFYIARQFSFSVLALVAALTGLVSLFDFIDLLRRAPTPPDVPASLALEIAALHLPYFCIEILPFGVLLGGIICFWRLTRSSELIVARAAGISVWQFLAAPLACAIGIGALATALLSPLSSATYARAEALDNTYLRSGSGSLNIAGGQLWLRQSDSGLTPGGVAILHARTVRMRRGALSVQGVSVFRLDDGPASSATTAGSCTAPTACCPTTCRSRSARWRCPPTSPWRGCRRASPPPIPCRSGPCPASSPCSTAPGSPPYGTASGSRRCWRCRCWPAPWRWSPPGSPCARCGAAASRA